MISKGRKQLIKFGLEQEYMDWKTKLPVIPKVGDEFIIIGGGLEGKKGVITKEELSYFYIDIHGTPYDNIICEKKNVSKYLKFI